MTDLQSLLSRVEEDLAATCPPNSRHSYALVRREDVRAVVALLRALIAQEEDGSRLGGEGSSNASRAARGTDSLAAPEAEPAGGK
jgi:hypothetical protein